jgi:hypothetical protein
MAEHDAQNPRQIAIIKNYDQLRMAISEYCTAIGMTREMLDARSGMPDGYSGKLLGAKGVKRLGPLSLELVLTALGLRLVLTTDPETQPRKPR